MGIYIHQVQPLEKTHAVKDITKTRLAPRTCYFTSYVDAALDAFNHNLIRLSGLRRVMIEAVQEFENIPLQVWATAKDKQGDACDRESSLMKLCAAIERANQVLETNHAKIVIKPKYICEYPCGTAVHSMYGSGVIEGFDEFSGIYRVSLHMGHHGLRGVDLPPMATAYLRSNKLTSSRPSGGGRGTNDTILSICYVGQEAIETLNRQRTSSGTLTLPKNTGKGNTMPTPRRRG